MAANSSKYHISIADIKPSNFEVLNFTGFEEICRPYRFDVEFKLSGKTSAVPDESVLGERCRLDIEQNGETISYCGIVAEFSVFDSEEITSERGSVAPVHYMVSIAPTMHKLSLGQTSRIFQRYTIPEIIRQIIKEHKLGEYFDINLNDGNTIKYPEREFCVQHNESDLAFISRLMEESGIWYWFEKRSPKSDEIVKERAVITDDYSKFPLLGRAIPFMKGSGFSETSGGDKIVESVSSLSRKSTLMPKRVRVRSYDHIRPESMPDGFGYVTDGHVGDVYEYGGHVKYAQVAQHLAKLRAARIWVDNKRTEGKSNSASVKSGFQVSIEHSDSVQLNGTYLILSVAHRGGWCDGAYTYSNEFVCVRADSKIYAPPLRTPVPRIDGVITAQVGATGDMFPTLDEHGYYNVNMPYDVSDPKERSVGTYGRSKDIRVAQPSGGISTDGDKKKLYGFHFPVTQGAEMVLAYVDGNPDRPVGLGFVPNGNSPSVVTDRNPRLNVIRTWGGNVLAMDDTRDRQKIVLATSGNTHLDNREDSIVVGAETPIGELLLDNENKATTLRANKHKITLCYSQKNEYGVGKDDSSIVITTATGNSITLDDIGESVTVQTKNGNVIKMDDVDDVITVQSSNAENKVVVNGKDNAIALDSMGNTVVVNGKDERITVESNNCKGVFDGKGNKIMFENTDSKIIADGSEITLECPSNITLKTDGELIIDAGKGIKNKGMALKMDS